MIPRKQLLRFTLFCKFFFLLGLLCFLYSCLEPYWLEEKTTTFSSEDLPQNFVGKKILFLSDVHHDRYLTRERIARVVARANALEPDLIILGGDFVSGEASFIAPCFEELSRLRAPLGVYGVTGNHDSDTGYRRVVKAMKNSGIVPLENDARWIEIGSERIRLGGVKTSYGEISDAEPTWTGTQKSDFVLLVSHNPDFAEEISDGRVDLMLSGHTHGGQLTLLGLWAPYLPSDYGQKYATGLVQGPQSPVLVSNGIGTGFLPLRFFARPQLNLIVLEK